MIGPKPLILGSEVFLDRMITSNHAVGARSARDLEKSLGYAKGRLDAGWAVLLLKQKLTPEDFKFSGITLLSGGRSGLPATTWEADAQRPLVHDDMLREYGTAHYRILQEKKLAAIPEKGTHRLVKVVPVTPHDDEKSPAEQYPMGGGGLQWRLIRECRFLVAMTVDSSQIAYIPGFSIPLGESTKYDDRAKLRRHLDEA